MIPYGRQSIDDDDIAAVVAVLRGDWLTQGPHVDEFEEALADARGARHAVAFANGTAALHGAAAAAGLGPGDVVGDLAAVVRRQRQLRPLRRRRRRASSTSTRPRSTSTRPACRPASTALVAVHYAGLPVDLARAGRTGRGS